MEPGGKLKNGDVDDDNVVDDAVDDVDDAVGDVGDMLLGGEFAIFFPLVLLVSTWHDDDDDVVVVVVIVVVGFEYHAV